MATLPSRSSKTNSAFCTIRLREILFHGDKDKIVHPRNSEEIGSSLKRTRFAH
jgi:hypothetical protein